MKKIIKKYFKCFLAILIGIFITLILLEFFLRIFGWWEVNKFNFYKPVVKNKNEIIILALGDSMTALGGINSYPLQLEKILNNSKKINKKVNVINGGIVGANSSDILLNIDSKYNTFNPDMVLLMTGINDFGSVLYEKNFGISDNESLFKLKTYRLFSFIYIAITNKYAKGFHPTIGWFRDLILLKIGQGYIRNGEVEKGVNFLRKILSVNPKNTMAYRLISENGYNILSHKERESLCKKAISIDPYSEDGYFCLSTLYVHDKNEDGELDVYKDALKMIPKSAEAHFSLARLYIKKKMYIEAEKELLLSLSLDKDRMYENKSYELLYKIYGENKNFYLQNNVKKKIVYTATRTINNLKKIHGFLSSKNTSLISIQYPMRDIETLKLYLKNHKNTNFVDNQKSFEDAVNKYGYDQVFIDAFAGDFGHCTPLGNKIIAENVAQVILNQVFKK